MSTRAYMSLTAYDLPDLKLKFNYNNIMIVTYLKLYNLYNTIQYNWAFILRFNKNKSCTRARYATFLVILQGE